MPTTALEVLRLCKGKTHPTSDQDAAILGTGEVPDDLPHEHHGSNGRTGCACVCVGGSLGQKATPIAAQWR